MESSIGIVECITKNRDLYLHNRKIMITLMIMIIDFTMLQKLIPQVFNKVSEEYAELKRRY